MRVLLTGATGFLGSHLLHRLLDRNHEVGALIQPTSDQTRIADCAGHYRAILGSLDSPEEIQSSVRDFAPQALAHLAWAGVENSTRSATLQFTNIEKSHALVKLAIDAGVRHVLALGSQAEYGPCPHAVDENAATRPATLYGATKVASHHVTRQQCEANSVRCAWMRLFSAYGPQDNPRCLIPHLISKLLKRERVALTKGEQLWDYIFARDAADAMVAVLECDSAAGIFNLGSGRPQSIRRVACLVRDLIDPALPLGFGELAYPSDQVMRLEARIDRLTKAIAWAPCVSLEEGLRQTIAWHLTNDSMPKPARTA
jgi:UDP-glucose 4-epimerase